MTIESYFLLVLCVRIVYVKQNILSSPLDLSQNILD
jgi:hypothetical protein